MMNMLGRIVRGRIRPARPDKPALCEHGTPVAECTERDDHAVIREVDRWTVRPHPGLNAWTKP